MKVFCLILFSFAHFNICAQWQGFKLIQTIPVQERPVNILVGKADHDAYSDLIVIPPAAAQYISVFKGSRNGFVETPQLSVREDNYSFSDRGDLNGDGIDDLVISGYWRNGFKVFTGNTNGEYTAGNFYGLTGHGKNLKVTDINNDGALDVVALSGGSGQPITLHIYHGDNTGTLHLKGVHSSLLHTDRNITIVDKDQNGLPDIMVSTSFPHIVIFYQQSDGAFIPRYWPLELKIPFTSNYYLADLNNDSQEDLIAYYYAYENPDLGLQFHRGEADTVFQSEFIQFPYHSVKPVKILMDDLDQDGNLDLIMDHEAQIEEKSDTIFYFLGNGDFTFQAPKYFLMPSVPVFWIVKDSNGDAFPDIIAYGADGTINVVENAGTIIGQEEPGENLDITVFPNPFEHHISLELSCYPATIKVYTLSGQELESLQINEITTLNAGNWKSGIYILEVTSDKKIVYRKIVRQ